MAPTAQLSREAQPWATDTVSAATAAITANPNFTAALASAISSMIGAGSLPGNGNNSSSSNNNNNANATTSSCNNNGSNNGSSSKMNAFPGN